MHAHPPPSFTVLTRIKVFGENLLICFERDLNNSFTMIFNPLGVFPVTVMNIPALGVLDAFDLPTVLFDEVDLTPDTFKTAQDLIALGLLRSKAQAISQPADSSPDTLTAWLHLTDRCNLRCDYCYLPHVREDMSIETGRAAIDATFRSAIANNFKQVKLKYAGGEPLLRFPVIMELHLYAQMLAEKYSLALEGVVLSNGTLLTAEMIETLKSLDLRLMISLDGLGQYHDAHRPYAGGQRLVCRRCRSN